MQAKTAAAVALLAMQLQEAGQKLLSKLAKPKAKKGGGGNKAESRGQGKNTRSAVKKQESVEASGKAKSAKQQGKDDQPPGKSKGRKRHSQCL